MKALVYGGPGGTATIGGTGLHLPAGNVPVVQTDRIPGHEDHADRCKVGITEISPTEWRVSDRTIPDGDPSALLGFIRRVGDFFEVTNFGRVTERSYFSSFERATASLIAPTVLV